MRTKDLSPQMLEMKKCAGRAKTQLFRLKKKELTTYYLQECAKSGVFPLERNGKRATMAHIPAGEPIGKERYKITMKARSIAQNKIRKEFYDLYLEFYDAELSKSGLERNKTRWGSLRTIESLKAEVVRLEKILSQCRCGLAQMLDD
jgi:hypothetical protein